MIASRLLLALAAVLLAGAPGASTARPQDRSESIAVDGTQRTYVVHVPASATGRLPLVLAFHGHFGTGAGQERLSHFDAIADRYGFLVAYPDGIDRGWNDGRSQVAGTSDDLAFVKALLDALSARYSIDRRRIYAMGMSNGATFTQYLACNLAGRLAAIAPVAGSMPADDLTGCRPARALSVLEIGGTADRLMPYDGGTVAPRAGIASRGTVLSLSQTVAFWAARAGCSKQPLTTYLSPVEPQDGTHVVKTEYRDCSKGNAVVSYTIEGGGHAWPDGWPYLPAWAIGITSNQLDASDVIAKFFLAHPAR